MPSIDNVTHESETSIMGKYHSMIRAAGVEPQSVNIMEAVVELQEANEMTPAYDNIHNITDAVDSANYTSEPQ